MAKLIGQGSSFTEQKPHPSHKLGKRAVVIGAGMGGLAVAGALVSHLFVDLDGGQLIALGQDGALQSAPTTTRSLENSGSTSRLDTQTNGDIP